MTVTTPTDWIYQETTGTYERPFASSEASYGSLLHFFDSTGTYSCGVTFRVSQIPRATVVALVQEAIGRFRFYAPIVACNRKVYQAQPLQQSLVYKPASSAEEVEAWAKASLSIEEHGFTLAEYLSQQAEVKLPYVHPNGHEQYFGCFLVFVEEDVYSFVGRVSHALVDGRPYLDFTRFVLNTIVSPTNGCCVRELEWGTEWNNLLDCPSTLARRNVQFADRHWEEGWKELQNRLEIIFQQKELGESLKPSWLDSTGTGSMARAIRQIDATSLNSIKNELSLIGYNMAVLVPAAHILTVFQRNEPLRPNSYVTLDLSMIDTARFFPPEYSGPLRVSSRTAFVPLIIQAINIDWETSVRNQLICIMQSLDEQIRAYLHYPQLTLIDTVGPRQPDVAPMHPHTCIVSYVGVVDMVLPAKLLDEFGDCKLEIIDFNVVHRHAGGFQRPSHIFWSFRGQLYMLIQASDNWDVKYFEEVLKETTNNMLQLIPSKAESSISPPS